MKKFILAAAVAGVLAGCNSDDVEKALLTDLSSTQAQEAAETSADATSLIVRDILEQCDFNADPTNDCAINGDTYSPNSLLISFNEDTQTGVDNFEDLELKVSYDQAAQVITLSSDNSGKYLQYDDNLEITYSNEGKLDHKLEIDVSGLATDAVLVSFDAQNIMKIGGDTETFRSSATDLNYDSNSHMLEGTIVIKDKDGDRDFNF